MPRLRLAPGLAALALLPALASAAGFNLSENGAKTLLMGGAFAGQADDLSALQHNPAGLAQLSGFNFLADGQLVIHDVSFQRYDPGFDPEAPPKTPAQQVSNSSGPFLGPMLGAGYGLQLFGRTLFVGAGVYGPPANGKYVFPRPSYAVDASGKLLENARRSAPQRYALIDNDVYIVYPTLSLAYAVHPRVMLGVSLQPVLTSFKLSQAVTSIDRFGLHPKTQTEEDPIYDSVVSVDLPLQYSNFTAIFGALVKPTDWLQLGVSFRPQIMINARGKLAIQPGPIASAAGTVVTGDDVTLSLLMPAELKVGLHVRPLRQLGVNFDFIYEGWQSIQELVLAPQGVSISALGSEPTPLEATRQPKRWRPAFHFRLGASYALFPWLSLYLGGWYETGAIPREYLGVDFAVVERATLTGGAGVRFAGLELLVGAAGSPAQRLAVTQSEVRAGSTEPDPAPVVGTGVYTTSNVMFTVGLRGHFGGGPAPAPPAAEPQPSAGAPPPP